MLAVIVPVLGYVISNNHGMAVEPAGRIGTYLSDLEYTDVDDSHRTYNGWSGHDVQIDKNQDGGTIKVYVDDELRTFTKGIGLHARGAVVYDISEYSTEYPRFLAYLGLDATKSGSIWFRIDASRDGETWETVLDKTEVLTNKTNAVRVDIDIEGYKYLQIYADPNGSNASDHSNIADAKLVTEDYVDLGYSYTKIHKIDYYDEIISQHDANYNLSNNYHLVLERELVNKLDFWDLQTAAETVDGFEEIMDWILGSDRILEEIVEVGDISDTSKFLTVLRDLYANYKDCLSEEDGETYERMMVALATAYSTDYIHNPITYGFHAANYDYVERFRLVKKMFDENMYAHTDWIREYHMELLRMMMQDFVRSDETLWLNYYIRNYRNDSINSTGYVPYGKFTTPLSYFNDEANFSMFDERYHFTEYNEAYPDEKIPYGDSESNIRYWMFFGFGGRGIRWRISRIGQSLTRSLGYPASGSYQPQHESYLAYTRDANGNGKWVIGNNIFGWGKSSTTWGGSARYRIIFDWGNKPYAWSTTGGNSTAYILLGQANLNNPEAYEKSLYLNLVANSYSDANRKVEIYKQALSENNLNLESYESLINAYKSLDVSDDEWMELVSDLIDVYTYYPNAMYDLIVKLILPEIEDGTDKAEVNLKIKEALDRAYVATADDVLQFLETRQVAASLLGLVNDRVASFSFDGEHAKEIVIESPFDTYNFSWNYSLDGGNTWSESKADANFLKLSDAEVSRINAENDIQIHIDGLDGVAYTIDITEGSLPDNLYGNDLENRVIGADETFEWRYNSNDAWTSYLAQSPDLTGNKTVEVRAGATGSKLASASATFSFTEDNQPITRKYIPISHLTVADKSQENATYDGLAVHTIDGNYNTFWYNNVSNADSNPFITLGLDSTKIVSAIEIVPHILNNYGRLSGGVVKGSLDGENFFVLKEFTVTDRNYDVLVLDIDEPREVNYIRIEAATDVNKYFFVKMINVFEDATDNSELTASIGYSTTKPTNSDVVARLINISCSNYSILSDGGDTHTFTSNGEWEFRFIDNDTGKIGTATARVDWIDKTAPIGTFTYSTTTATDDEVIATLSTNKKVKVINNGYYEVRDGVAYDYEGISLRQLATTLAILHRKRKSVML